MSQHIKHNSSSRFTLMMTLGSDGCRGNGSSADVD